MSEDGALVKAQMIERKWFVRTLIASLVSAISYVGISSARILAERAVASVDAGIPLERLPAEQIDQLRYSTTAAFLLFTGSGILLVISGSLFLGFLVRWLFAIRAKRKVEAVLSN